MSTLCTWTTNRHELGKTTESAHCAKTGPCLHMRHRNSACRLYRFGRFITN